MLTAGGGLWGTTCVATASLADRIPKAPTAPAAVERMFDHYREDGQRYSVPTGPVPVERMFDHYREDGQR